MLIVEDETQVRNLVTRVLRNAGYNVLEAASGPAALRLAAEFAGEIHLVLSDVVMPEMNGPAMVERLLEIRKGIRVIFVSGYTTDDILRRGFSDPNVTFLPKPFAPRLLLETLQRSLA